MLKLGALLLTVALATQFGNASSAGLVEGWHNYTDADGNELSGWVISQGLDGNPKRPGLVVFVGPYGSGGSSYEREVARTYANKGMVVFLPDYFAGHHSDTDPALLQAALGAYGPFLQDPARAQSIAKLAVDQLASFDITDTAQMGAIGFCFGGAMTLNAARAGADLKVAVSLHGEYPAHHPPAPEVSGSGSAVAVPGSGSAVAVPDDVNLGAWSTDYFVQMVGDNDPLIPQSARGAWVAELSEHTAGNAMDYDLQLWGNTLHAFSIKYSEVFYQVLAAFTGSVTTPTGVAGVIAYDPERAAAAFDRIDDLLATHGLIASAGGPPSVSTTPSTKSSPGATASAGAGWGLLAAAAAAAAL